MTQFRSVQAAHGRTCGLVLCLSSTCCREGPARRGSRLHSFLVVLQVEGRSTHFEPGYLLIANILCLWLGVGQGCDGCQPPLGLDGGRRAEALAAPRVLPAPRALVCTCHVCRVPRAQLGQGVGGGAASLHLLTEKAVLSGGTRTCDSSRPRPRGQNPGRVWPSRPWARPPPCVLNYCTFLLLDLNSAVSLTVFQENNCTGRLTALPVRWACHACQPREWCHHPVPLPSAPPLGVPAPCQGHSQTCELGRR